MTGVSEGRGTGKVLLPQGWERLWEVSGCSRAPSPLIASNPTGSVHFGFSGVIQAPERLPGRWISSTRAVASLDLEVLPQELKCHVLHLITGT